MRVSSDSDSDSVSDTEVAARLVRAGLGVAFARWAEALDGAVETKTGPTDVVTVADRDAEARMLELLRLLRPEDGVVAEEGSHSQGTSGRTWVLDPLDGTYNFTRSSERWCCAAALSDAEGVLLGAVAGGGAGRLWLGGRHLATTEEGERVARITDCRLARASVLTYLHPPHHATEVGEDWRRLVAGAGTLRMTGSGSLDAADVACGRADLLVQHSVPDWDRLPGQALIHAAGGDSRLVQAHGVTWYLAGAVTAVAEAAARLRSR